MCDFMALSVTGFQARALFKATFLRYLIGLSGCCDGGGSCPTLLLNCIVRFYLALLFCHTFMMRTLLDFDHVRGYGNNKIPHKTKLC
jgi:hypothetical protein